MPYSIDSVTDDCYEGAGCLINKFGITDQSVLSQVEADITFAKTAELEKEPLPGVFDTEYYKKIHSFLFGDLYDWAGTFRKINISKKGTLFADHTKLEELSDSIFSRLKRLDFLKGMNFSDFIDELVDLYCSLNMLHPFREGNGRVQRVFLSLLIRYNGYTINFSEIDKDMLMISTIQAAQGINDNLKSIFAKAVKKAL